MKRVSILTFLILFTIFPAVGNSADLPSDADFAKLESEYAAAKQEFADEVKKQKDLAPSELHSLREKIVGPKKQALDEAYSKRANARRIDPKDIGASAPRDNPLTGGIPDSSAYEDSSTPLPSGNIPAEIRYPKNSKRKSEKAESATPSALSEEAAPEASLGAGVTEIRYPKSRASAKPSPGE